MRLLVLLGCVSLAACGAGPSDYYICTVTSAGTNQTWNLISPTGFDIDFTLGKIVYLKHSGGEISGIDGSLLGVQWTHEEMSIASNCTIQIKRLESEEEYLRLFGPPVPLCVSYSLSKMMPVNPAQPAEVSAEEFWKENQ